MDDTNNRKECGRLATRRVPASLLSEQHQEHHQELHRFATSTMPILPHKEKHSSLLSPPELHNAGSYTPSRYMSMIGPPLTTNAVQTLALPKHHTETSSFASPADMSKNNDQQSMKVLVAQLLDSNIQNSGGHNFGNLPERMWPTFTNSSLDPALALSMSKKHCNESSWLTRNPGVTPADLISGSRVIQQLSSPTRLLHNRILGCAIENIGATIDHTESATLYALFNRGYNNPAVPRARHAASRLDTMLLRNQLGPPQLPLVPLRPPPSVGLRSHESLPSRQNPTVALGSPQIARHMDSALLRLLDLPQSVVAKSTVDASISAMARPSAAAVSNAYANDLLMLQLQRQQEQFYGNRTSNIKGDAMAATLAVKRPERRQFVSGPDTCGTSNIKNSSPHFLQRTSTDNNHLAFPVVLHEALMALDGTTKSATIATFLPDGKAFRIISQSLFTEEVLPMFFPRMATFASFQRQLNLYDFKQIGGSGSVYSRGTYCHPLFGRDSPFMASTMKRIKDKSGRRRRSRSQTKGSEKCSIISVTKGGNVTLAASTTKTTDME